MAVSSGDNSSKKKKSFSGGGIGRTKSAIERMLNKIAVVLAIVIIILCLFGFINQAQTGQSIIEFYSNISNQIGSELVKIFTNEEDAILEIGTEGVYIDGHSPEGSEPILNEE